MRCQGSKALAFTASSEPSSISVGLTLWSLTTDHRVAAEIASETKACPAMDIKGMTSWISTHSMNFSE
jgi:hypothetical protein